MNGFIKLVRDLLCDNGLPAAQVYCEKFIELPGWYRPEKKGMKFFSPNSSEKGFTTPHAF